MQRNFKLRNNFNSSMPNAMAIIRWTLLVTMAMVLQQIKITGAAKFKGESCTTKNQPGICREWSECPVIRSLIESGQYTNREVVNCGFNVREELICCPIVNTNINTDNTSDTITDKDGFVVSTTTPRANNNGERPAARACRRIEYGLISTDRFHVTNDTSAVIGEFPHMAAIGFSPTGGDNREPYKILCGGSLIDKRFVMTAAHCFEISDYEPIIVRLGVVNFTDPVQMSKAVEIRIKNIYEHPEYNIRYKYNDIAIVELERDVETSELIYPVCLYMNETEPDPETELWVTGWGPKKLNEVTHSDSLMKGRLYITPMDICSKRFIEHGCTKPIPQGITHGIICAENMKQRIDACQGDSGGPLNLLVNKDLRNYRVVGIVNSGISCAGNTPGLYTKVATFIDFIESIVWPNGGD